MSNPRLVWCAWAATLVSALGGMAGVAHAEGAIDEWAHWIVSQRGVWKGQTVPFPEPEVRPALDAWVLCGAERPLCVHAPADVDGETVAEVLAAAEEAYDLMARGGWQPPGHDGGRGGTMQHDLYLVDLPPDTALSAVDVPNVDGNLDGAITFSRLPRGTPPDRWTSCAVASLTEASVLSLDPAEAAAWRRATGAFVAWLATGAFGCDDDAVSRVQDEAHRGWISADLSLAPGSGLLLALLSDRTDGGSGTFVRELWQLARQYTWTGRDLRGSPDLWEALVVALANAKETLARVVEDFAVARYFARPGHVPTYPTLRALVGTAQVPVAESVRVASMPAHLHLGDPPLAVFGSRYVLVDTNGMDPMGRLKVWLRAEMNVEWSMVAVRLDAHGRESGRITAPPRTDPRSYFPVELLGETSQVLLVVTNLGYGTPDADVEATRDHGFSLIIDRDRPDSE